MDDADHAQRREELQREDGITSARILAAFNRWPQGPVKRDCLDCEEPIPEERLAAIPGAVRCTTCQEAHERTMRARRM